MKPSQFILPLSSAALGLALGVFSPSLFRESADSATSSESTTAHKKADWATRHRTNNTSDLKATNEKKTEAQRVPVSLKTVGPILKEKFKFDSKFDELTYPMEVSLPILGATEMEKAQVMELIRKTEAEILTAEKTHLKLGEVTKDSIQLDRRGMREPVEQITKRMQDEIRTILPNDLANALISGVDWTQFYNIDDTPIVTLEVVRRKIDPNLLEAVLNDPRMNELEDSKRKALSELIRTSREAPTYQLYSQVRLGNEASGMGLDLSIFKDDGTPLPAELSFGDRWKPHIKGLSILPIDGYDY